MEAVEASPSRFQCHLCPGSVRSLAVLRLHLRGHSAGVCSRCQRRFAHAHLLALHRRLPQRRCRPPLLKRRGLARRVLRGTAEGGDEAEHPGDAQKEEEQEEEQEDGQEDEDSGDEGEEDAKTEAPVDAETLTGQAFRCPKCRKECKNQHLLKMHLTKSSTCGDSKYPCPDCGHKFAYPKDLLAHRNAPKACQIMRRRKELLQMTSGRTDLPENEQDQPKTEPGENTSKLACPKCSKPQNSAQTLRNHLSYSASCGDREKFRCRKCARGFSQLHVLGQHMKNPNACARELRRKQLEELTGGDIGSIRASPSRRADEALVAEAKASTGQDGSVTCPKCGSSHVNSRALRNHLLSSKRCGDSSRYPCPKCGHGFAKLAALGLHMESPTACRIILRRKELERMIGDVPPATPLHRPEAEAVEADEDGNFPCPKCSSHLQTAASLRAHLTYSQRCGDRERVRCPKCDYGFRSASNLRLHLESPRACEINQRRKELEKLIGTSAELPVRSPEETAALDEILKTAEEKGSFACPKCESVLINAQTLRNHLTYSQRCGGRERISCPKCSAEFGTRHNLQKHLDGPKACEINLRRSQLTELISSHGASPIGEGTPVRSAEISRALEEAKGSPAADGSFQCPKCPSVLSTADSLRNHLTYSKRCGDREKCLCPKCGYQFGTMHELRVHLESPNGCEIQLRRKELEKATQSLAEEEHGCPKCGKAYASRDQLRSHLTQTKACAVFETAKHICRKCGFGFMHLHSLAAHLKSASACKIQQRRNQIAAAVASDEVACPKCGEAQKNRERLLAHLNHSKSCGDKEKLSCASCPMTFATPGELQLHTGRPKACELARRKKEILDKLEADLGKDDWLRCPNCAYMTRLTSTMGAHLDRPTACKNQIARVRSLSLARGTVCANCDVDEGSAAGLLAHLGDGSDCLKMRRLNSPALPFLEGVVLKREPKQEMDTTLHEAAHPSPKATKAAELLRCVSCSFLTDQPYKFKEHAMRPNACRVQNSRVRSLAVALGSSVCPNCAAEQGGAQQLLAHLEAELDCQRMARFTEPVIPMLARWQKQGVKVEPSEAESAPAEAKTAPKALKAKTPQPTKAKKASKSGSEKAEEKAECGVCGASLRSPAALAVHRRRNKACRRG